MQWKKVWCSGQGLMQWQTIDEVADGDAAEEGLMQWHAADAVADG